MRKEIKLNIEGDIVYLNNEKTNLIKDGLIHIIQNAADHGIEKVGFINISVKENKKSITITITDNGRGIDIDQVMTKAIQKNIIKEEDTESFTTKEKMNLIMKAGFSTKSVS